MKERRLVVLDRDGVINVDVPGRYVSSVDDWIPIEGSLGAIGRLAQAGFDVYVVSNQSGIGRGFFTVEVLAAMHAKLLAGVAGHGGAIAGWFYCPHVPEDDCQCRKPRIGLLSAVSAAAGAALERVPFIGDKTSDLEAARAAGMRGMLVGTGHGRQALHASSSSVTEYYADLAAATGALIEGAPP